MPLETLQAALEAASHLLTRSLFTLAGVPISLVSIATFGLVLLLTLLASRLIRRGIRRAMERGGGGLVDSGTAAIVDRIVHYLTVAVGSTIALQVVGIDLSALFAAGAVVAVGLGFALQDVAKNFVSGIILLLERSITPGDILVVDGQLVRVKTMGIRATRVTNLDDEDIILPNGALVQATVRNLTLDSPVVRLRAPVGVAYATDLQRAFEVLEQVGRRFPHRVADREPVVLLLGFGASSVDLELSVWIAEPWRTPTLRTTLFRAMWDALHEAGITIAFPQLDVHFDREFVERLAARG